MVHWPLPHIPNSSGNVKKGCLACRNCVNSVVTLKTEQMDFSVEVHEHGNTFPFLINMKILCLLSAELNNGPIQSQEKTDFWRSLEKTLLWTSILRSLCMGGITPSPGKFGRR